MKNIIQFAMFLMLITVPFSVSAHGYSGNSSSVSIGISGGAGSFYYSQQQYNRSVTYRSTVNIGIGGRYYGGHQSVYYGGYYGSGRQNHIHRQEGRRYVNDVPCIPVVVVLATNRHHRHYRGCGCRY